MPIVKQVHDSKTGKRTNFVTEKYTRRNDYLVIVYEVHARVFPVRAKSAKQAAQVIKKAKDLNQLHHFESADHEFVDFASVAGVVEDTEDFDLFDALDEIRGKLDRIRAKVS